MTSTEEIELAILGTMLVGEAPTRLELTEADFTNPNRARLFAAIQAAGPSCAAVAAATGLKISEVTALLDRAEPWNFNRHERALREATIGREFRLLLKKEAVTVYAAPDVRGFMRSHRAAIDRLEQSRHVDFVPIAQCCDGVLQKVGDQAESGGGLIGLSTGFPRLNRVLGGLAPGDLVTIASGTSVGKTSLATNIAIDTTRRSGSAVLYVSLEMSAAALGLRILASMTGIPATRCLRGDVTGEQMEQLAAAAKALSDCPLYIHDKPSSANLPNVAAAAASLRAGTGLDLLVVDYLQLMKSGEELETRNGEVSAVSRGLKELAMALEIPVIALSQLNRNFEREKRLPVLSDLRDSGSIEQDSDSVIFLHRPTDFSESRTGLTTVIVAKNRRGETGKFDLWFDFTTTTFRELST